MNKYEVISIDGRAIIIEAEKITETEDVVLFVAKSEIVGIVPLINIIAVKERKRID